MLNPLIHPRNRSIGFNIVDPVCDKGEMYTLEVYLRNLAMYAGYGIRHVEFSHVMVIDENDAREIREFCRRAGIVPWSIHSEHLNAPGSAALHEYLANQTHCVKVAKALDATMVVCHVPNLEPHAADLNRDLEILNRLADIIDEHGLKLAIETGPPASYIIELADRINRPSVGLNLDTGHSFLLGEDPAAVARDMGARLFTTHLQDNFGENDDHQAPGMGFIDWRSTLRALLDTGYDGPLLVEVTGDGVKARRTVKQLHEFPLDKEILFTQAYLGYLLEELEQANLS